MEQVTSWIYELTGLTLTQWQAVLAFLIAVPGNAYTIIAGGIKAYQWIASRRKPPIFSVNAQVILGQLSSHEGWVLKGECLTSQVITKGKIAILPWHFINLGGVPHPKDVVNGICIEGEMKRHELKAIYRDAEVVIAKLHQAAADKAAKERQEKIEAAILETVTEPLKESRENLGGETRGSGKLVTLVEMQSPDIVPPLLPDSLYQCNRCGFTTENVNSLIGHFGASGTQCSSGMQCSGGTTKRIPRESLPNQTQGCKFDPKTGSPVK